MNVDGSLLAPGNSAYEVLAAAPACSWWRGVRSRFGQNGCAHFSEWQAPAGRYQLETLLASIPGDQLTALN